jgi:hypothetical protein
MDALHRSLWDDATKGLSEAQLRAGRTRTRTRSSGLSGTRHGSRTLASTVSSSTVSRCSTRVAGSIT